MGRIRTLVPELPRTAWMVLAGDTLSAAGTGLTLPFLFVYLHRVRGIGLGATGLAVSMVAVASFFGNPTGGSLSDRIGSRTTLIIGLIFSAVGTAGLVLVHSPWQAFIATALLGFGNSVSWPSLDALLASAVTSRHRSDVFSVRHATSNAGFGIGMLVAAAFVNVARPATFVVIWLVDAATFIAFVPFLLRIHGVGAPPSRTERLELEHKGGYRAVLADAMFLRVWVLTALLVTISYGQLSSAFPAFATRPGGISAKALALAMAANTLVVVFAQLVVLRILAGVRRTRAIVALSGCWALCWAITIVGGTLGSGPAAIGIFMLAMVAFALGETLLSPTIPPMVNDLAREDLRGRYNGVATLAWTTGFMAGPALAGFAFSIDRPVELFFGLIAACGAGAVLALRLERTIPASANVIGGQPAPTEGSAPTSRDLPSPLESRP